MIIIYQRKSYTLKLSYLQLLSINKQQEYDERKRSKIIMMFYIKTLENFQNIICINKRCK